MEPSKTWNKCKWFESKTFCPQNNNELMKTFIIDISGRITPDTHYSKATSTYKNEEGINKLCESCKSFINKRP